MNNSLKNDIECWVLLIDRNLADVSFIFKVNGSIRKVPGHKLISAALSPVFKAMFYGPI